MNHPVDAGNEFAGLWQSHWRKEKEKANPLGLKSRALLGFQDTFWNKIVMAVTRKFYKVAHQNFIFWLTAYTWLIE